MMKIYELLQIKDLLGRVDDFMVLSQKAFFFVKEAGYKASLAH